MYKVAETLLAMSEHDAEDFWYIRERLYSNGTYLRDNKGERFLTKPTKKALICVFTHRGSRHGITVDEPIASRVVDYFENYFKKNNTNCASFAHFLMTGVFQECSHDTGFLVNEHTYCQYRSKKPVRIGDVVCILYANERALASRKGSVNKGFRRCKKKWHDTGEFTVGGIALNTPQITKEKLRELYYSRLFSDYHFMVCIGHLQGEPVWIMQNGWHLPGDKEVFFQITVGNENPYPYDVPAIALIKRSRSRL